MSFTQCGQSAKKKFMPKYSNCIPEKSVEAHYAF